MRREKTNQVKKDFPDELLIQGFLNGDTNDFNILYSRYKKQMYSYLNRLLPGQPELADDMFQQTWIKVIHQLPKYRSQNKFLGWVMRISHNLVIDYFRKNKHEKQEIVIDESRLKNVHDDNSPWKKLMRKELEKAVSEAMVKLPVQLREVFLLRQEKVSFKEIAKIQNISINTALGRMQYALKHLKALLNEW